MKTNQHRPLGGDRHYSCNYPPCWGLLCPPFNSVLFPVQCCLGRCCLRGLMLAIGYGFSWSKRPQTLDRNSMSWTRQVSKSKAKEKGPREIAPASRVDLSGPQRLGSPRPVATEYFSMASQLRVYKENVYPLLRKIHFNFYA